MSTSIVMELQDFASSGQMPVSDLLRKALVVATRLKVNDIRDWIECERTGYAGKRLRIPTYRRTFASLKSFNPVNGVLMPVSFTDSEWEKRFTAVGISNSIVELEKMLIGAGKCVIELNAEEMNELASGLDLGFDIRLMPPKRYIDLHFLSGIIETVRNKILDWSLNLSESGITGEGMTFSNRERNTAAATPAVHIGSIGTFNGNLAGHDLSAGGNIQIGGFSSINDQLKQAGVSQVARNELETIMDALKTAKPKDKKSVVKRGMDWVNLNKAGLGTLAVELTTWFGNHYHGL